MDYEKWESSKDSYNDEFEPEKKPPSLCDPVPIDPLERSKKNLEMFELTTPRRQKAVSDEEVHTPRRSSYCITDSSPSASASRQDTGTNTESSEEPALATPALKKDPVENGHSPKSDVPEQPSTSIRDSTDGSPRESANDTAHRRTNIHTDVIPVSKTKSSMFRFTFDNNFEI